MVATDFRIELTAYAGPIDLLLYLVRREEVDLTRVSLSKVIEQYLAFLDVLTEIDMDGVADFVEIVALLIEMKSSRVLPGDDEVEDVLESDNESGPQRLVHRLFEYKRFRDVAGLLDQRAIEWQTRFSRKSVDIPRQKHDLAEQPIVDLHVWDLVSAFGRILKANQPPPQEEVVYDDTPIHVHMKSIHALVKEKRRVELQSLFEPGQHKSRLIAMFLATLELTRHHGMSAVQDELTETIWLTAGQQFKSDFAAAEVDNLDSSIFENSQLAFKAR